MSNNTYLSTRELQIGKKYWFGLAGSSCGIFRGKNWTTVWFEPVINNNGFEVYKDGFIHFKNDRKHKSFLLVEE